MNFSNYSECVSSILKYSKLLLVLDALDECGADGARGLVEYFRKLSLEHADEKSFSLAFSC